MVYLRTCIWVAKMLNGKFYGLFFIYLFIFSFLAYLRMYICIMFFLSSFYFYFFYFLHCHLNLPRIWDYIRFSHTLIWDVVFYFPFFMCISHNRRGKNCCVYIDSGMAWVLFFYKTVRKIEVVLYSRLASTLSGIQIKKQNKMLAAKNAALRAACSIIISQYFHVLVHVSLNDGVLIIILFGYFVSLLLLLS